MRITVWCAAVLLLAASLTAFQSSPAQSSPKQGGPADLIGAAKQVDQQFVEAVNRGDVEAANRLLWNSPLLVSYPADAMVLRGYSQVADGNRRFIESIKGGRLELYEQEYMQAGDVVLTRGLFRVTGLAHPMNGRFTDAKAFRDGRMVYIADHVSFPLPPAQAARR